jgi:hypothetical protein
MDNKLEKKQNPGKPTWRKGLIILIIIVAVAAAIITTLISIKMLGFNEILKSQSGYYILHLELAYTVSQVQDVINSWQGNIHITLESIRWDWFLILSYVIFLTAFYYLITWKFKEAFKRTWTVFLFFPLAAGIFDVIENIFMLNWLKSSEIPGGFAVFLGSLSATVKFLLIILTILAIFGSWLIKKGGESTKLEKVLAKELKIINKRRGTVDSKNGTVNPGDLFGIALSGGGIRSATLSAGILDIFNQVGIFSKADYLSTVSGGGYIGGYVQAKLWRKQMCNNPYKTLFDDNDISHLEENGEYLTPGKNTITKFFSYLRLGGAFVFSMIMNFTWFLSLLLALFILVQMIFGPLFKIELAAKILWGTAALVFSYHFFGHSLRILKVGKYIWSSKVLNIIEGVFLLPIIVYFIITNTLFPVFIEKVVPAVNKFLCVDVKIPIAGLIEKVPLIPVFLITLLILFISAIFYNPNVLSLHRFFKEQLSMTYLETNPEGKKYRYLKLVDLNSNMTGAKGKREWKAPYPLINTCLNLLGEGGNGKKGLNFRAKLSDYFLLSPLFCGSYRTGYVKTDSPVYRYMTLSTAISISGAAINPNMGVRTNRFVAFFMALLNLKSGYWALNPRKARRHFYYTVWPYYLLRELFSSTNTNRWKINLSDGGHIENLAVFELLRRKCRLIIAVDAGADPGFDFSDLKNLVIRARNELGIVIKFRAGQDPESIIKPKPSIGYSDHHFAIADVEKLPTRTNQVSKKIGVLIYLKSSLKAPLTNKTQVKSRSKSYDYKTNHPDFPHESTADQFFDEAQWEAYYDLGKRMAGDLLKIDDIEDESLIAKTKLQLEKKDVNGLIKYLV